MGLPSSRQGRLPRDRNFHLRVEARINKNGNSGAYFRSTYGINFARRFPIGYEAQILHSYPTPNSPLTGSLVGLVNVVKSQLEPDEWFTLEVLANRNRIIIKVNGVVTTDIVDEKKTNSRGHLALQAMSDKVVNASTVVEFHKIEVKEIPKEEKDLVLRGHKARVRQVLFTPDGSKLITGSNGNHLGTEKNVLNVKMSGLDNSVRIWNLESGKQIRHFDFTASRVFGVQGLSVSLDGKYVAACTSWDWLHPWMCPWIYVWEISSGERKRFVQHSEQVFLPAITFSGDGETFRVAHSGKKIHSWSVRTGEDEGADDFDKEAFPLTFAPNGKLLVGGDDKGNVWLWDAKNGKKVATLSGHVKPPRAAAVSKDGTRVVTCAEDFSVRLWEIETEKELTVVKGLDSVARTVAISPDGTRFVTGHDDGAVRLWDAKTGKELTGFTGHTGKVLSVAISPNGRRAASGGEDTTVRVWGLPAPKTQEDK